MFSLAFFCLFFYYDNQGEMDPAYFGITWRKQDEKGELP